MFVLKQKKEFVNVEKLKFQIISNQIIVYRNQNGKEALASDNERRNSRKYSQKLYEKGKSINCTLLN